MWGRKEGLELEGGGAGDKEVKSKCGEGSDEESIHATKGLMKLFVLGAREQMTITIFGK